MSAGLLGFPHEKGLCAREVEQEDIAVSVHDAHRHRVGRSGIVGVQQIALDAVRQCDDLIASADIDVVPQVTVREKLHANTRRKIERRVGAHEPPGAEDPVRTHGRRIIAGLVLAVVCTLPLSGAAGQVASAATPPSAASQPPSSPAFDHSAWDALLRAHVRDGLVDYDAFAKAPTFRTYLAQLARADLKGYSEAERLAFWLNTYNAYTVALIVNHGERESIRNIDKTLGFLQLKGPWNERLVAAAGKQYTLDHVEHRILRNEFHEPRIHFAMVPAAYGGPPLRSEAYTGARLEEQLEDQGRRFLRDTLRNPLNSLGTIRANPILMAYQKDFGATRRELAMYLAPYFEGRVKARLDSGYIWGNARPFDWRLNATGTKPLPSLPSPPKVPEPQRPQPSARKTPSQSR